MAIDQKSPESATGADPEPIIENEFPSYRAISASAVTSLVLALASVFCFADLWFLLVVAASVAAGFYAIRQIRRYPEVLTGTNFARVGIGVSLAFGLAAVAQKVTEEVVITLNAKEFANNYIQVIKEKPLNESLWWQQSVEYRQKKTPDEVADDVKKSKSPMSTDPYLEKTITVQKMKDRLRGPGETIHYSRIETKVVDGLTIYANALIDLDGPGSDKFPKEEFALLQMIKRPGAGRMEWVVQDVKYPYTPASAVATIEKKADDDGHGHSH